MKYNTSPIEKTEKKEKFKHYSTFVSSELKKIDLLSEYGKDFISKNGLTIHDYSDLIKKLDSCGNNQKYSVQSKIDADGVINSEYSLVETNACHCYSLCPACASAKRSSVINSIKPYIKTAELMDGVSMYMVTITIKGSTDAENDYNKLRDSWTNFCKLGQRREDGKRSGGEASKFLGTVLSIEVIPENVKTENYHVHGHILAITDEKLQYTVYDQAKKKELHKKYGKQIPKEELTKIAIKTITDIDKKTSKAVSKISEEWNQVSGDINIDVSPIKNRVIKGKKKSIENQLYEIIKYETKPWELSPEKMIEAYTALKNKKRITKSGIFIKNKAAKKEWYNLLEKNFLVDYFNKLVIPDTIIEDENEEILSIVNSSIEIDYNPETLRYQTTYGDKSFQHMETETYKQYLKDKAKILCIYKARIKNHIKLLLELRSEKKLDPQVWINQKEQYKYIMRDQIKLITTDIKRFIQNYYSNIKKAA